jgi:hypothetical protein
MFTLLGLSSPRRPDKRQRIRLGGCTVAYPPDLRKIFNSSGLDFGNLGVKLDTIHGSAFADPAL